MSVQWVYGIKHLSFSMHTFLFIEHAIGASDATASYELQVNHEVQEGNPEVEVQPVGLEEPEEEVECPNHEPALFIKGKPRSILSLPLLSKVYLNMLYLMMQLSIGVVMKPLLHFTQSLSRYLTTIHPKAAGTK